MKKNKNNDCGISGCISSPWVGEISMPSRWHLEYCGMSPLEGVVALSQKSCCYQSMDDHANAPSIDDEHHM